MIIARVDIQKSRELQLEDLLGPRMLTIHYEIKDKLALLDKIESIKDQRLYPRIMQRLAASTQLFLNKIQVQPDPPSLGKDTKKELKEIVLNYNKPGTSRLYSQLWNLCQAWGYVHGAKEVVPQHLNDALWLLDLY